MCVKGAQPAKGSEGRLYFTQVARGRSCRAWRGSGSSRYDGKPLRKECHTQIPKVCFGEWAEHGLEGGTRGGATVIQARDGNDLSQKGSAGDGDKGCTQGVL